MDIRDPSQLPSARLPEMAIPPTVSDPRPNLPAYRLSLDEAIRTALANSDVVRVLTGLGATSSGRTIYDPAITNTQIDQARGRFDPAIGVQNNFHRWQTPQGVFDPTVPSGVRILGVPTHDYDMSMGLSKTTASGGTGSFNVNVTPSRTRQDGLTLNPQTPTSMELGFTQPVLQGGGLRPNLAPIVIARIDTERSFFQMKDSVQQMVRGVIEGYWALVFARVNRKVRHDQVEEVRFAFERAQARLRRGFASQGEVAQAESALERFEADLIGAEAEVLQREAALRNIMGLPVSEPPMIVPVTPPLVERLETDWTSVISLAEERRPDLIELKLIIEADQQQLLMARNQALPQVDVGGLYRWNGLAGKTPWGDYVHADPGDSAEWQLGVNFSVPLGLRQARAELRQQELIILRDRMNLQQGVHNAMHELATTYRNLAQYHDQYRAFTRARAAAERNLAQQRIDNEVGRTIFLNVLEAITSRANTANSQSQTLLQYNTQLAVLEEETGTILETHGVRFVEERFGSIGPLGRLFRQRYYPRDSRPGPNADQYRTTTKPAENVFHLDDPNVGQQGRPRVGPPLPPPASVEPLPPAGPSPNVERLRLEVPERLPVPPPDR